MYRAKNRSLTFNGIKMDYLTFGLGSKPLVLIPGLSTMRIRGKALAMSYAYRIFAKDFKCYMFDRKDQVEPGYSISDMADELAQAMKQLNLEKAVVVGISQGGMIAQTLAIDYPDLVGKLVLGVTLSRVNETALNTIGNWIKLAQEDKGEKLIIDSVEKIFSESYVKRRRLLIFFLSKMMKPKELERFIILADSILHFDVSEQLEQIICPVFVIGGAKDKVVGASSSQELADALHCDSYIYPDLGHSAYIEGKDFNQKILAFLHS